MKKTELFEKMELAKGKKEVVELVKQYFSELGVNKEGDGRKAQVLECLEVGMTTKEIAEKIGIKATNVASVLMALKKDGNQIVRIDGKMVLAKNVNIAFVGKDNKDEIKD